MLIDLSHDIKTPITTIRGFSAALYENLIEECKKENMLLHVWTVNEEKDMKLLYENQIDSIITNYPDVARKIINQ